MCVCVCVCVCVTHTPCCYKCSCLGQQQAALEPLILRVDHTATEFVLVYQRVSVSVSVSVYVSVFACVSVSVCATEL